MTEGESAARPTDEALLARVGAGDRAALERLYARIGPPLLGYLHSLTPDRGLAEEILQDTLVAIWRGAGSFAGRSGARTWIFGVAHRQAHNALRRHTLPLAGAGDEAAVDAVADPARGPEDHALARAGREELIAALERVSPAQRATLVLVLVRGLSLREAGAVLGVPEGTVKSRLHHAKGALRAALAERRTDL